MLWHAVSENADERDRGWDGIWGSLNHQGDFYNSTVATIPYFIRFLDCEEVPHREQFLSYLYDRYLDAANYGGDPLLDDPPGGEDVPTPMIIDGSAQGAAEDLEESDLETSRRMDLCAWQTGRAIRAGLPVYESLLNHSNKEIAGNAANLMLLWHESREAAQVALRAAIDAEKDAGAKAELLLKYGVYGSTRDAEAYRYWTARTEPMTVRTAAAICWARAIEPAPLPDDVHALLDEATVPQCPVFGVLPWLGVYNRGLWTLPPNMAHVLLPLAANEDNELRWRAVQGLMPGRKVERWLRREDTCPILVGALTDSRREVRSAAALALAEIGDDVLRYCPDVIDDLISAVDDDDEGTSGHAARLLATLANRLSRDQRADVLSRTKAAARRFRKPGRYVHFMRMGVQADAFLMNQHNAIRKPVEWTLEQLWQAYAFPEKEDNVLKPADVNRRLANAFKDDAEQVIQSAIDVLAEASDRSAVLGAAKWLTTLGPVAEQALAVIDSCAGGKFDSYIDGQMALARRLISEAVEFEATNCPATADADLLNKLTMQVSDNTGLSSESWRALLEHSNWLVRFEAASAVASVGGTLRNSEDCASGLRESIRPLLRDVAFDEVCISGEYDYRDQIYQWRRQRRSVAGAAVRAIFSLGLTFESDDLLDAMLREAMQSLVRCGDVVVVSEYSATEWRLACESASGGFVKGEMRVRTARQRCHQLLWSGDTYDPLPAVTERNLQEAILRLSGRLVPHDEL